MPLPAPLRRFKDWTRHWRTRGVLAPLQKANEQSRSTVLGDAPVVVSLTSYGARLRSVHLAIESIAAGAVRPQRLILWIDDAAVLADPPPALQRLRARGLELRPCIDHGPHKKYYPYVQSQTQHALPLLTADDDMMYPPHWLAESLAAHTSRPGHIQAWRARVVVLQGDVLAPYARWPLCRSTAPSARHFATGASGVMYPPGFLDALRPAGTSFLSCCPKADDVWLHCQALRTGWPVQQIQTQPQSWPCIPGTETQGLMHSNIAGDGNDVQIGATYTAADVQRLAKTPDPG